MKQKITQCAEKITSSPKQAWGALAAVLAFNVILTIITSLISPAPVNLLSLVIIQIVVGFIVFMIMTGLTSWASKIIGLEKRGFIRALGALSLVSLIAIPATLILGILSALIGAVPAMMIVVPILALAYIVFMIWISLFVFSKVYGVTKGQSFGLIATAHALLAVILLPVIMVLGIIASTVLSRFTSMNSMMNETYMMEQMQEIEGFELDEEALLELEAALGDIEVNFEQ